MIGISLCVKRIHLLRHTEILLLHKRFHDAFLHNIDRTDAVFLVIDLLSILIVNIKRMKQIGNTHWLHGNTVLTTIVDGSNRSPIGSRINDNLIT